MRLTASATRGHVLVTDDDPTVRYLAATALEEHGFSVSLARDGAEAHRLFTDRPPDLVLMDIGLPDTDGFQLCRALRGTMAGEQVPILLLTQRNDVASIRRAYQVGATDFQTKPVSWRVLCERVQYIMRASANAKRLRHHADSDSLTGVASRRRFLEVLEQSLRRNEATGDQVAVIFVDLDGFKDVNDQLGHGLGDQLLRRVAGRLARTVRLTARSDSPSGVVGRLGGDEFGIVVPDLTTLEHVPDICRRLHEVFETPFTLDGREVFLTVSTGVSTSPRDGLTGAALIQRADRAMYQAKAKGRNGHCQSTEPSAAPSADRVSLSSDLRRAIRDGEFHLCYQPQVDIRSGAIVGAEALIRWTHPHRGRLSPNDFVGAADDLGLGPRVGDWVMAEAMRTASHWSRRFTEAPIRLAVNISNAQFHVEGLLHHVARLLAQSGLPPGSLEVEVTEDVIIEDPDAAQTLLLGLRELGVSTAVDDFGTGRSSLSVLRHLPVDALKIDRSFVQDVDQDQSARAIVSSIVELGHHLGLLVVAEGVETTAQCEVLRALNCDRAQGYLFGRAMPADDFEAIFASSPSSDHAVALASPEPSAR